MISACQNDILWILITLLKFDFVSVKASGDRPPPYSLYKITWVWRCGNMCVQTHYVVLKCNFKLGHQHFDVIFPEWKMASFKKQENRFFLLIINYVLRVRGPASLCRSFLFLMIKFFPCMSSNRHLTFKRSSFDTSCSGRHSKLFERLTWLEFRHTNNAPRIPDPIVNWNFKQYKVKIKRNIELGMISD